MTVESVQAAAVDHLASQGGNGIQHILHHGTENIRTHVGLGLQGDVVGRTHVPQGLQHQGAAGIVDAGQELSVGKRTRASRAELDVGLGVQPSLGIEAGHSLHTVCHVIAAVDEDGGVALLCQQVGAEKSRRPHAHHQGSGRETGLPVGQGQRRGAIGLESRGGQLLRRKGTSLGEGGQHGVDQADLIPLAGVHRLLIQAEGHSLLG